MRSLKFFTLAVLFAWNAGVVFGAVRSDVADAVMRSDKAGLRTLLQQKADVNAPQIDGATALHWAVYHDDLETVDALIKAGANADPKNREGVTPLHMASLYGNSKIVDRLLKAGANAKQKGPAGETILMLAARNGNPEVVTLLIAAGADVNAKEPIRGTTALMWAVEQRHPAAVAALLDGKADVALKSAGAGVPRNYMANRVNGARVETANKVRANAAKAGRTYEEELEVEQKAGTIKIQRIGDVAALFDQLQNGGGNAQAAQAAQAALAATRSGNATPAAGGAAAAAQQDDDLFSDFVFAGLVGTGGGGLTALVLASREGDLESAKLLLAAHADVNQQTEYGWTPLLTATNNRHYKLSEYLIEHGADVNKVNKGNWTPLYLATDNRNIEGGDFPVPKPDMDHLDYIKFLLDHGANPNLRVKDNTLTRTIFTMQWFLEAGATPFIRAAQSSDLELLKMLLAHGADPMIKTDHGDTALTAAAGVGWVDGVTYEHSRQANIDTVKFLLDLGLDPNAANEDGRTPLMVAAAKGSTEVIQILVDHGAKLETRDKGSRDTETLVSVIAGHTWQALDYADGLVRFGVQSAVNRPEASALLRKLMTDRGLPVPPANRTVDSICIVEICKERIWNQ
jgi:ankyrin repeat protein